MRNRQNLLRNKSLTFWGHLICMAPRELAEVCQKKKLVVLVSRNDKENSEYAAEVCETK